MTDKAPSTLVPESDRASSRIGQVVANRYRLEALLGMGATGAVYRAAHPGGHAVAVKILDSSLMDSDVAQRFARESQLMMSIHHPHVVRTLAAGRDDALGILYLVMPLLRGEDLDAVIQRHGALEPTAAVRIALQAARGIAAAHRLGVVHRDIKPANLFLDSGADGRLAVRVCDFGIAKGAFGGNDIGITRTGTQLGTPDYISPEQLKDSKNVDARADIWGLGATLYELLSGQPPFAHHSRVFDVIAAILGEEIAWLQDRAPWIEGDLALAVHRALRRNRAERHQTMDAFVEALLPHSSGDGALTQAHLVPVSPILRKVQKPRAAPPPSEQRAPVSRRTVEHPESATVAKASQQQPRQGPEPAPARPPASPGASQAKLKGTEPKPKGTERKPKLKGAEPESRGLGLWLWLFLMALVGAAVLAALVALGILDWRPLLDALVERARGSAR